MFLDLLNHSLVVFSFISLSVFYFVSFKYSQIFLFIVFVTPLIIIFIIITIIISNSSSSSTTTTVIIIIIIMVMIMIIIMIIIAYPVSPNRDRFLNVYCDVFFFFHVLYCAEAQCHIDSSGFDYYYYFNTIFHRPYTPFTATERLQQLQR